jgi:hypothetical protein
MNTLSELVPLTGAAIFVLMEFDSDCWIKSDGANMVPPP